MTKKQCWISVKDRMPKIGQHVWYAKTHKRTSASGAEYAHKYLVRSCIYKDHKYYPFGGDGPSVEFWMPLEAPPAPQKETEEGGITLTPEEEQAIRDSVKWVDLPNNLLPLNDAYRTRCDQLLEAMQDLAVANAKLAERDATIAALREALNRTLASATEGQRIAQERITKLCAEIATIQSNAADNYAAAENRAHEAE